MLTILNQPEKQDLFLKTIESSFKKSNDWSANKIKQAYDKIRSEVEQAPKKPSQSIESESDESSEMKSPLVGSGSKRKKAEKAFMENKQEQMNKKINEFHEQARLHEIERA